MNVKCFSHGLIRRKVKLQWYIVRIEQVLFWQQPNTMSVPCFKVVVNIAVEFCFVQFYALSNAKHIW